MTRVAYRGSAPIINDLLGKTLPFGITTIADAMPQHRAGGVKIVAVSSAERSPFLPDVPTFDEAGVKGYDSDVWWALLAPARLPGDVKAKISRDAAEAMKSPVVKERFEMLGAVPIGSTSDEVAALIRADYEKWGPVIKAAGIVPE